MGAAIDRAVVVEVIDRCARGAISAPVAAMRLLVAAGGADCVAGALAAIDGAALAGEAAEIPRLLRECGPGCAAVATRASEPSASGAAGVAEVAAVFDAAAAESEEAAVALYSLGDAALLRRATIELADALAALGVLGEARAALDLGCGIGRVAEVIAPRLGSIHGVDVSARMIDAAIRRCRDLGNVAFTRTDGRDLSCFAAGRFDLVLMVDAMPYVHAAGLADGCFAEVARVLRPGGDWVVINFSYRSDLAADRADLRALCDAHGFAVIVDGAAPFALWDGVVFHLRRASLTRAGPAG